jgi:hypothetical protein
MSTTIALDGLDIPTQNAPGIGGFGQGPTEIETRIAIAEIEGEAPLTGARRMLKQLAISRAISIDKGTAKGRAIANEASQLFELINHLAPAGPAADAPTDDSHLTPETRRLLDALAAPAEPLPAPEGDAEGL